MLYCWQDAESDAVTELKEALRKHGGPLDEDSPQWSTLKAVTRDQLRQLQSQIESTAAHIWKAAGEVTSKKHQAIQKRTATATKQYKQWYVHW